MTTHTDLAAQALAALKHMRMRWDRHDPTCNAAIAALESTERLAGGGEPVAFVDERAISWLASRINSKTAHITTKLSKEKSFERPLALYTTPPPQAESLPLDAEQAGKPVDKPSPTAGMNIAQRILHVGGRNNAAGYVEFGSIQAIQALVRQVLRDLPRRDPLPDDVIVTMYAESPSSDAEMVEFARAIESAHGIGTPKEST